MQYGIKQSYFEHGMGKVRTTFSDSIKCIWNRILIVRNVPNFACEF